MLGYVDLDGDPNEPGHEECMIRSAETGHQVLFIEVPDAKQVKNRLHFDLRPTDGTRDEEVARLLSLGATEVDDHREPGRRHRLGGAGRPRGQRVLRPAQRRRTGCRRHLVDWPHAPPTPSPAWTGDGRVASRQETSVGVSGLADLVLQDKTLAAAMADARAAPSRRST